MHFDRAAEPVRFKKVGMKNSSAVQLLAKLPDLTANGKKISK
jgi:hypothetical protein